MEEIEAKRKIPHENIGVDDYNMVHTLVEDIYKDFKNQKCRNCKRSIELVNFQGKLAGYECKKEPMNNIMCLPKTFGCNKWVAK